MNELLIFLETISAIGRLYLVAALALVLVLLFLDRRPKIDAAKVRQPTKDRLAA